MLRRSVSLARYDPLFGVFSGGNRRVRGVCHPQPVDWSEMQNYVGRIMNVLANSGQCSGNSARSVGSARNSSDRVPRRPRSASEGASPSVHREDLRVRAKNEESADVNQTASEIAELERQLDAARQRQRAAEVAQMVKQRAAEREQEEKRRREEEAAVAARKAAVAAERARCQAAAAAEAARERERQIQAYREKRMKEQEAKWTAQRSAESRQVHMEGLRSDCDAAARRADEEIRAGESVSDASRLGGRGGSRTPSEGASVRSQRGSDDSGASEASPSAEGDRLRSRGPTSMSTTEYAAAIRHYQLQRRMREEKAVGFGDWSTAGSDPTWHCRRQWHRCSDHAAAFEPVSAEAQEVNGSGAAHEGAASEGSDSVSARHKSAEKVRNEWLSQQAAAGARFFGVGREDFEGDSLHRRSESRGSSEGVGMRGEAADRRPGSSTSAAGRGQVISRVEAEKRYADPSINARGGGAAANGFRPRAGEESAGEGAEVEARRAMMEMLRGGHSVADGGRGTTFSPASASVSQSTPPQRTFERVSRAREGTVLSSPRFVECEEDGVSRQGREEATLSSPAREESRGSSTPTRAERIERVERELREGVDAVHASAGGPSASSPATTTTYRTPSSFFTPSAASLTSDATTTACSSSSSANTSPATVTRPRAVDEPVDALTFQQLVMRRLDAIDERLTSLSDTVNGRGGRGGDAK